MPTPRPPQPDQLDTPQPQGNGQPNPMHMPKGIPSAAPRSMDPQYQQQQMMQKMMAQQMSQQPRMGMAGGGMSRRMFLKLMSGLAALPFIGKGVQKAAPKVLKEATKITRGPDGIPSYAYDLIEVVKAKGTKEIMEGIYKRSPPSTKYNYKGVELTEDGLGNTSVRKEMEETKAWTDEANDDVIIEEAVDREIGFEIRPQYDEVMDESGATFYKDIDGKKHYETKIPDEYNESTAYLRGDPEGGPEVDELLEVIDDADHLELKKIADEIGDVYYEDVNITGKLKRPKKASGGLAHMLGE